MFVSRWLVMTSAVGVLLLGWACRRPPAEERHGSHDLVTLFELATVRRETHRIDLGAGEARRFLEEGWSWDEAGEITFAWGVGRRSTVRFFLTRARELKVALRGRPAPSGDGEPQGVAVAVNDRRLARFDLRSGWKELTVEIPAAALRRGWNQLELRYRRWQPGPRIRQLAVQWDWILFEVDSARELPRVDRRSGSLRLPFGSEVEYYLTLPGAAALHLDSLRAGEGPGGAGAGLELLLQPEGRDMESLGVLEDGDGLAVALGAEPVGIARLVLRAVGSGDGGVTLTRPRVLPVERADAGGRPRGAFPNVILYLIDALRADRVGAGAGGVSLTPHFDALAEESVVFPRAVAQSSWTKPAVASLFTGLLPPAHGVLLREHALSPRATTLAEALLAAGYRTAAFSTNPFVSRSFGLDQGFLDFTYLDAGRTGTHHAFSDQVNDEVFAWLDRHGDRPFFLYVHTIDPHAPYTPPRPDGTLGGGESPPPVASCQPQEPLSEAARRALIGRYDEEVAFNDASLGRLVERLREAELYDDSLMIVLSDHGEAFWEHGGWQHENFLYGEVIDIPLLIKPPGGAAGSRAAGTAQQIDVLPTILGRLALAAPAAVQGDDLLAVGERRRLERVAYSYLECPSGKRLAAVIAGPWKLIRTTWPDGPPARLELYHRREDPGESDDLAAARPEVVERLRRLLERGEHGVPLAAEKIAIDEELGERLRALGYVD